MYNSGMTTNVDNLRLVSDRITAFVDALNTKFAGGYVFTVDPLRKYTRITQETAKPSCNGRLVYCFIDSNGFGFKSAGWKAPAKGPRFYLSESSEDITALVAAADPYGSWLYRNAI
jgi:hypothetical protein